MGYASCIVFMTNVAYTFHILFINAYLYTFCMLAVANDITLLLDDFEKLGHMTHFEVRFNALTFRSMLNRNRNSLRHSMRCSRCGMQHHSMSRSLQLHRICIRFCCASVR